MSRRDFFKKTQQRTYRSRSYKNPHLKEKIFIPWKFLLVFISCFFFIGGTIIYLLGSTQFSINTVEVRGLEYVNRSHIEETITQYIQEPVFFFFSRSNTFLFSREELNQRIMEQFSLASLSINLHKKMLSISLEERTSHLIWETAGKSYLVDLEGIVVREQEENMFLPLDLPHFVDKNNTLIQIGSQVLKKDEITNTFFFLDLLLKRKLSYRSIEIDRLAGKWMQVVTLTGFGILFDVEGNMETQYRNLEVVLEDQQDSLDTLHYIDLRFGDRVYFK